uniref:Uncharacterized protein n=1 Tax=Meloidogyne enterolobii TaxID=390850 RepID=A0A6V7V225_MELEN|nr:unnamed protein product [Meloidogyne enterolobii]
MDPAIFRQLLPSALAQHVLQLFYRLGYRILLHSPCTCCTNNPACTGCSCG